MENTIPEILTDEVFEVLSKNKLLSETGLRNYSMKKEYRELRKTLTKSEAMDEMLKKHPYLQYDTILKVTAGGK